MLEISIWKQKERAVKALLFFSDSFRGIPAAEQRLNHRKIAERVASLPENRLAGRQDVANGVEEARH
jgi:hypothetical protein